MQRLISLHSQLVKNDTFRKGESRTETMLIQHYPNHSVVQFNRSRYLNAMNVNMMFWINRFVDFWNSNPNIKVSSQKIVPIPILLAGLYMERRRSLILHRRRSRPLERAY